jgi:hypothetical protein
MDKQERNQADDFDCDLYRMIRRAQENSDAEVGMRTARQSQWYKIALALNDVRSLVRTIMHPDDVKRTR